MLSPQIKVNDSCRWPGGPGVALKSHPAGKYAWHWGDQGDSKCYFTADLEKENAILYFTNSYNGLSISTEMLKDAIAAASILPSAGLALQNMIPPRPAFTSDIETLAAAIALPGLP